MTETFLFVSNVPNGVTFYEATAKRKPFARIEVMAMELNKKSTNNRRYRFADRHRILKSIEGSPIFYGLKVTRTVLPSGLTEIDQEHDFSEEIGFAESARVIGNKVYATIKITAPRVLKLLKRGFKDFLFSAGGIADKVNLIKSGKDKIMEMVGAAVTHISMWKNKHLEGESGFPNAKMTKLLEFSEASSLLYTEFQVCENGVCQVLGAIRTDFEEAKAMIKVEDDKIEEAINKTINEDINRVTRLISNNAWRFIED